MTCVSSNAASYRIMRQQPFITPLSNAQREIERVRIIYDEEAVTRRARTAVAERLHETQLFEQSLTLKDKIREMRDGEIAMLNILEDTRELEEKLGHERDRLSLIISSMEEGLVLIDNTYRILLSNPAAIKILGITTEEMSNVTLADITTIWVGDKKLSSEELFGKKTLAIGTPIFTSLEDDVFTEMRNGKKFLTTFTISPSKEHDSTREAVVVFRDITKKKRGNIT